MIELESKYPKLRIQYICNLTSQKKQIKMLLNIDGNLNKIELVKLNNYRYVQKHITKKLNKSFLTKSSLLKQTIFV